MLSRVLVVAIPRLVAHTVEKEATIGRRFALRGALLEAHVFP